MPSPNLAPIRLSSEEREALERWIRRPRTAQALALRARIILTCEQGGSKSAVAKELDLNRVTVAKWRSRFLEHALGRNWLITEYSFDTDWPRWAVHPNADEFVYLLSGKVELLLEVDGRIERVRLSDRAAVVVPRGVWHTAEVRRPSRMLHVTMGIGTQNRHTGA